jgi:hypothetical protein
VSDGEDSYGEVPLKLGYTSLEPWGNPLSLETSPCRVRYQVRQIKRSPDLTHPFPPLHPFRSSSTFSSHLFSLDRSKAASQSSGVFDVGRSPAGEANRSVVDSERRGAKVEVVGYVGKEGSGRDVEGLVSFASDGEEGKGMISGVVPVWWYGVCG